MRAKKKRKDLSRGMCPGKGKGQGHDDVLPTCLSPCALRHPRESSEEGRNGERGEFMRGEGGKEKYAKSTHQRTTYAF